ncbi:MAG: hypothetical protein P4L16_05545 [Chlamydiales bacterium]|nr:hypothetical protein [Chlamydiales bacterium]
MSSLNNDINHPDVVAVANYIFNLDGVSTLYNRYRNVSSEQGSLEDSFQNRINFITTLIVGCNPSVQSSDPSALQETVSLDISVFTEVLNRIQGIQQQHLPATSQMPEQPRVIEIVQPTSDDIAESSLQPVLPRVSVSSDSDKLLIDSALQQLQQVLSSWEAQSPENKEELVDGGIWEQLEGFIKSERTTLRLQIYNVKSFPDIFSLPCIRDRIVMLGIRDNLTLQYLPDSIWACPNLKEIDARGCPNLEIAVTWSQRNHITIMVDNNNQIATITEPVNRASNVVFDSATGGLYRVPLQPHYAFTTRASNQGRSGLDYILLDDLLRQWEVKEGEIEAKLWSSVRKGVISFQESEEDSLALAIGEHKSMPNIFGGLFNLKHVDVSGNLNLESLPDSLLKLSLQSINIRDCKSLKLSKSVLLALPITCKIYADRDVKEYLSAEEAKDQALCMELRANWFFTSPPQSSYVRLGN